ncbi:MAG: CHAD domain-containing protein [Ignavibacteria bacterium]|nr:CHAD domain-containing protein [Ignavibacteria bacterium]
MDNTFIIKSLINRIKLLRSSYTENLEKVINDFDDEAIHDLRVSIRRILAFMSLVDELCGRQLNISLIKSLKNKIKKFNQLRDVQVQISFLINQIKKFPELLDFLFTLKSKEKKQISKLKKFLQKKQVNFAGELFFYHNNLKQEECFNQTTKDDVIKIAANSLNEVKTSIGGIVVGNYETYHKTRLKIKRFRYIIETVEQIIQSPREKLKSIQELQTILGEIQDYTVLLSLLERFCQKKQLHMSIFLNFVNFIKQKREEKENEFWQKKDLLEFWDSFFMKI